MKLIVASTLLALLIGGTTAYGDAPEESPPASPSAAVAFESGPVPNGFAHRATTFIPLAPMAGAGAIEPDAVEEAVEQIDEADLIQNLADAGLEGVAVHTDGETVAVEGSTSAGEPTERDFAVELDVADASAVAVVDDASGETELQIEISDLTDNAIRFTATDPATGDTVTYDSETGSYSAIPLILGIPVVISVLQAFLAAGTVVVVAGLTYIAAVEAIKALTKNGSSYQHFRAIRQSAGLFLGSGMTLSQAVTHARGSGDVWSRTKNGAKAVAYGVKNQTAVGPEKDKSGNNKYCHYHPANRTPASHAFYGVANGTC